MKSSVFDCAFLADELVEAMALYCSGAACVGVDAVIVAGRGAVERDFEADGLAIFCRAQNQMQIARVKTEDDFARSGIEDRAFGADLPTAS